MRGTFTAIILLGLFSSCSGTQEVKVCPESGREQYAYRDDSTNANLAISREDENLILNFGGEDSDYRPNNMTLTIDSEEKFFKIANLVIPKNFDDPSPISQHPCRWAMQPSSLDLYRITCISEGDGIREVAVFSKNRGIVEWGTFSPEGKLISNYVLSSEVGLLHGC